MMLAWDVCLLDGACKGRSAGLVQNNASNSGATIGTVTVANYRNRLLHGQERGGAGPMV